MPPLPTLAEGGKINAVETSHARPLGKDCCLGLSFKVPKATIAGYTRDFSCRKF